MPYEQPDDWPFETLKLGEYFSLARQGARTIREKRTSFAVAVDEVLQGRHVTQRERQMLVKKAQSIVYLGLDDE